MDGARKFHIRSYGCQMNVYDAERMAEVLTAEGYAATDRPEDADLVLLNTCHIREKAAEKIYSDIGRLREMKELRPTMRIGIAGCVAQAEGAEILRRAPAVDLVVGPQSYHLLPELAEAAARGRRPVATEFPAESKFDHLPARSGAAAPAAFLTVQEGCDKFCAFCVVPYTRGAEFSRPMARVLAEAQALVARGAREITLLGQNVNAYHGADDAGGVAGLAALIGRLARLDGVERIRYTTSHPRDMDAALIAAHGAEAKLMPQLHLPVQSGSDRVLKAMNRGHTADDYLRLVERLRAARPDMLLGSDFIAGFPGETDADFRQTLELIRAVGFAAAYSFTYSARPGTPAAERPPVPKPEADARLQELQALITAQQHAAQRAMVGRRVAVLIEKPGREPGQMVGKSEYLHAVHVTKAGLKPGDIVPVRITEARTNSLMGEVPS